MFAFYSHKMTPNVFIFSVLREKRRKKNGNPSGLESEEWQWLPANRLFLLCMIGELFSAKRDGGAWHCFAAQGDHYLLSLPVRRKVMVPQKRRARIWTGRWRSSSVYQIQILPRFLTTPASAVGCTRRVLNVPSAVLISSRPSTFMVTGTVCRASTTGMTKLLPTSMGCEDA